MLSNFPCQIDSYVYSIHTWKKVGILTTGCRRYGAKKSMQSGKKRRKIAKIKGKIRLIGKEYFLVGF